MRLKRKLEFFLHNEKFFVSLMDEMKIQSDLVWDKQARGLIGYLDLANTELDYTTLKKLIIL